jgi:hypothetical protein
MYITDAQRDVRMVFLGGFAGQLVSGILWLLSAGLATFATPDSAILLLVLGGIFIFPLTQLTLCLTGHRASLGKDHSMNQLAMYRLNWFYPAFMIALGAHYLPFVFLYGMRQFAVLAVVLLGGGVIIGMYFSSVSAWADGLPE